MAIQYALPPAQLPQWQYGISDEYSLLLYVPDDIVIADGTYLVQTFPTGPGAGGWQPRPNSPSAGSPCKCASAGRCLFQACCHGFVNANVETKQTREPGTF